MQIPLLEFDEGETDRSEVRLVGPAEWLSRKIERMRQAQTQWARRSVRERIAVIRRARAQIAAQGAELAAACARGSAPGLLAEALSAQVLPLAEACRFLEREAARILAPRVLGFRGRPGWLLNVRSVVHREPYGLVLVVAPSNYPLFIPGVAALQALSAGNAVLIKPGRGGSRAAWALKQLLASAGLDRHLLAVLPESKDCVHEAVSAGVDKVVLTGSAPTGISVLRRLAFSLVPATVELSGCDAVFVRADADLEMVVRALLFGLRLNGGATCIAPRRVFVHRSRATELEGRLASALASERPIRFPPHIQKQIVLPLMEALQQGAHLLGGTILPTEEIIGPVLLAGARPEMRLLHEDCFAPLLSLVTVEDDEEALRWAARCPFALGAAVFSRDTRAGKALAHQVEAGVVMLNDIIVPTADPRLPFGGRKRSGFGVTRGREGLLEMTVPKVVSVRSGRWRPHFDPPLDGDAETFKAYLQLSHGQGWRLRARALVQLIKRLATRGMPAAGAGLETNK